MIAVLELNYGGRRHFASLGDDGFWQADSSELRMTLNVLFDPHEECGPEHGAFGDKQVELVLERYGGRMVWKRRSDGVERVY